MRKRKNPGRCCIRDFLVRVAGVECLLRLHLASISLVDPNSYEFRYPTHDFLLKTIHRIVFLTQKPSQVRPPVIKKVVPTNVETTFLVRVAGVEPVHLSAQDPKSCVSANSTISANVIILYHTLCNL